MNMRTNNNLRWKDIVVCACVCLSLTACGTLSEYEDPKPSPSPSSPTSTLRVASTAVCQLDDQCADGLHCFQGLCTFECEVDDQCPTSSICSPRGRCIDPSATAGLPDQFSASTRSIDQSALASIEQNLPSNGIAVGLPARLSAAEGATEIIASITLNERPEGGILPYSFTFADTGEITPISHAVSDDNVFEIVIPVPDFAEAGVSIFQVSLVTPAGTNQFYIGKAFPLAGRYGGFFTPAELYGSQIPVDLQLEVLPPTATSFEDADEVYVWLRTGADSVINIPHSGSEAWSRHLLAYDASNNVWFARFGSSVPADFAGELSAAGTLKRSIRIEFEGFDSDEGLLSARIADRWNGLFDLRTTQGAREIGHATLNGEAVLGRVGKFESVEVVNNAGAVNTALLNPNNDLSACSADVWAEVSAIPACESVTSADIFVQSPAALQTTCSLVAYRRAVSGDTLRERILAFLDAEQPNPDGLSFEEFLQRCASASYSECVPSADASCARSLMNVAYRNVSATSPDLEALNEAIMDISSELYAGTKFAAFYVDTQARLKWLQSSEAPLFLASTLRSYNLQILETWKDSVIAPHLNNVVSMLDSHGLDSLTRATSDPSSREMRQYILAEATTSWEAAADALVLLIQRYNLIEQQTSRRMNVAAGLIPQIRQLYITAVEIQQIANNNGLSGLAFGVGPRLTRVLEEHAELSQSFNDLLFARDAEVVTSSSVDPTNNADILLREARTAALAAIRDAGASVDRALDEAKINELTSEVLAARYEDQILAVRDELINLCGLPAGCSASETVSDPACAVRVESAACGATVQRGQRYEDIEISIHSLNTSVAGSAFADIISAASSVEEAQIKADNAAKRVAIASDEAVAFSEIIQARQQRRAAASLQIDSMFDEILRLVDAQKAAAISNIAARKAERNRAYDRYVSEMDKWTNIRTEGGNLAMENLSKINGYRNAALSMEFSGDLILTTADMAQEVFPGSTPDNPVALIRTLTAFPLRAIVTAAGMAAANITKIVGHTKELKANNLANGLARGDVEDALDEAAMLDEMQLNIQQDTRDLGLLYDQLEEISASGSAVRNTYEALIQQLEYQIEFDIQTAQEAFEMAERRKKVQLELTNVETLIYQLEQANATLQQRINNYNLHVQNAGLLKARLDAMRGRWSNINNILGSPAVVFSFANRLELAEQRINRARRALEDWVVALEYFAVRPFLEQRAAIMLARNPQQLEAIANELTRLQSVCGGPVTQEKLDVSVRDNLLGLNYSAPDNNGIAQSPGARFRALLSRADSISPKSIRLSSTETLGQRLQRGNVLATSFSVSGDVFANLPLTCNAKVSSMSVRLVGIKAQDVQPVVTIVYDGNSELRSCQANIRQIMQAEGAARSAFDEVTHFRTSGRSISPVASTKDFGPQSTWNTTLQSHPLASGYTILIDLEHPANQNIAWEELEDIRVMFHYNYQDMFPEGQCG